ncbi:MAG TPA: ATP-dependent sacrificial sulfur transferase LarE [Acidimicrobiales bacterium]|nr:ATP-dependent sacrificial sulfur transferase LarE [Acidimicrobiales bacterium]
MAEAGPTIAMAEAALLAKHDRLVERLRGLGSVVVGFSGGADSALLAYVAAAALTAPKAPAVTAVSPSLAREELADCAALAAEWGLDWQTVETDELDDPVYVANDASRCARCKTALMDVLAPLVPAATVVLGVNVDDLGDHRPGQDVAAARGAVFPLVDAGLRKDDVRALSRHLGLRTWDKPAAACLASRLPYGTPVTVGRLRSVARAESALRSLGFRAVRVRHYGDTARVEVPIDDLPRVLARRDAVVRGVHAGGFRYVTLDLEGLRSGNLNASSRPRPVDGAAAGDGPVAGPSEGPG